ncbi:MULTISPECIES: histidine kinase dimerization/phosphoacceptor domain -containing protein [Rhodopseudomonas]|uniref:sensor histidine kinase n=1 Tax=Rhodopseudomonas TaxID=1073 RepID=UPI0005C9A33F|nr:MULTISPECIES: histidine kinase dimerization/phosphoacceptor domain -containing protein [Rhodopseudomonas]MDF3810727.1 histidine kinase dimerization/phosphoacceptor domain -containing protein [Rhodopseudomonas sp. BAL398]WOK20533.1 histidine kinase dimerization/phosphoacceptor domain -containing protein [Rhodopseudomonas sp. BAL398]
MPSEPRPSPGADYNEFRQDELPYRRRQQAILREFGTVALQTRDFRHILQQATELSARGLGCSFAKVLEYLPNEQRLIVRAGIGWPAGTVDHVSLGADIESPAGFAFQTGQSVISNHLQEETRFRTPALLAEQGIRRAINVIIRRGGEGNTPFGVLEADSPDSGQFDDADADFLAGFAGLLGIAIERQHADAKLQEALDKLQQALDHEALLTREMSHRVKNSLTSVVGLLRVQARGSDSVDVKNALENAAMRVASIAEVHDHLWRGSKVGFVDLSDFVGHLCKNLQNSAPEHSIQCYSDPIIISADKAIPLGLLVNELVTNAVKYAYVDGPGVIRVDAREINGHLIIEISDEGLGLPDGFDINHPRKTLGFRVINGLVRQLVGELNISKNIPRGSLFTIKFALDPH